MGHALEYLGEGDDAKGKKACYGIDGEDILNLHAYIDLDWCVALTPMVHLLT